MANACQKMYHRGVPSMSRTCLLFISPACFCFLYACRHRMAALGRTSRPPLASQPNINISQTKVAHSDQPNPLSPFYYFHYSSVLPPSLPIKSIRRIPRNNHADLETRLSVRRQHLSSSTRSSTSLIRHFICLTNEISSAGDQSA